MRSGRYSVATKVYSYAVQVCRTSVALTAMETSGASTVNYLLREDVRVGPVNILCISLYCAADLGVVMVWTR